MQALVFGACAQLYHEYRVGVYGLRKGSRKTQGDGILAVRACGNCRCRYQPAADVFDGGKSGLITWDEINKVIFDGRVVDDSLMNEYLGQIGKKKDDTINFMEFCDLVK